jgi:hypothetical protein
MLKTEKKRNEMKHIMTTTKWNLTKKYPVELVKGSSKKYTEYLRE